MDPEGLIDRSKEFWEESARREGDATVIAGASNGSPCPSCGREMSPGPVAGSWVCPEKDCYRLPASQPKEEGQRPAMLDPEVVKRLRSLALCGSDDDEARVSKGDLRVLLADWERRGEALKLVKAIMLNRGACFIPDDKEGLYRWDERARAALEGGKP